jgi:VCBS repeat-containing protein
VHPPIASDEAYATTRNATLTVDAPGVLENADDTPGDVLTAGVVTDPQHGNLTLAADGGFTYTPTGGYVGTDGFTYRVRDAFGNQDTADVVITVTNRAPVAANDTYVVDHGTELVVAPSQGVLANDTDADGDTLTATLVDDVANGTLAFAADGSFSYTPDPDFAGSDGFTYSASDGIDDSNVATVTIAVGNEAPTAVDDAYDTTGAGALVVAAEAGVLANDTDPDGDALTATLVDDVEFGDLVLADDGSFSYTPTAGNPGTDTFTYTASDGIATSNLATVTITVTNQPPVAVDNSYGTSGGGALTVGAPGVLGNDSDPEGDPISVSGFTQPTGGAGSVIVNANGSFTYTPTSGYTGTTTFTYTITDGIATDTATVTITVTNQAPIAVPDDYDTGVNTPLVVATGQGVLSNDEDPDGDPLTATLVDDVENGTLVFAEVGSFTYTPDLDFTGTDTFTYTASDGIDDSNVATVSITVGEVTP